MSPELRLLAALCKAEALATGGARIAYCLQRAASLHDVDRGGLAEIWIEKRIECERARAVVAGMREADDDAHEGGR